MKILHVEDDDLLAEMTKLALEAPGCTIDRARNASEALLLIEDHGNGYDAILLDLGLPDVPREETLRLMHSCSAAPKVVNTGGDVSWLDGHEAELGVYGIIQKGTFDANVLRSVIARAINQWADERRHRDKRILLDTATLIGAERRRRLEAFRKAL